MLPVLFLKPVSAGRQVGLGDRYFLAGGAGLQRNRIASAGFADRLRVNGRGTILANDSVAALVETHRAANFTGIEEARDFAVWLLVKPETNLGVIQVHD